MGRVVQYPDTSSQFDRRAATSKRSGLREIRDDMRCGANSGAERRDIRAKARGGPLIVSAPGGSHALEDPCRSSGRRSSCHGSRAAVHRGTCDARLAESNGNDVSNSVGTGTLRGPDRARPRRELPSEAQVGAKRRPMMTEHESQDEVIRPYDSQVRSSGSPVSAGTAFSAAPWRSLIRCELIRMAPVVLWQPRGRTRRFAT